jgi:hypothetical protein
MPYWRRVLVLGLLLCSAGARAHDPEKPNRHADRWEHYQGTRTCLKCHRDEAMTFFDRRHYRCRGGAPGPDEARAAVDVELGKLTTINDFCTTPGYQWTGEVVNAEGKVLAKGCSACHAGQRFTGMS